MASNATSGAAEAGAANATQGAASQASSAVSSGFLQGSDASASAANATAPAAAASSSSGSSQGGDANSAYEDTDMRIKGFSLELSCAIAQSVQGFAAQNATMPAAGGAANATSANTTSGM